jgi:hypothetical protein
MTNSKVRRASNSEGQMNFDPRKFFISLMDFFSMLLPGAPRSYFRRVISVHILCLGDCFNTTIMTQPTEITQFIFGQPEKTVRRHSVSRRTMLAGTAGVLGGAALASTARSDRCSCGPGRHHHRPAAIALRRPCMVGEALGGDPRAGARDLRSASSFVGSQRAPLSARPAARRYRQRSQHHSQRLCRMRLNIPGRRPDRKGARSRDIAIRVGLLSISCEPATTTWPSSARN